MKKLQIIFITFILTFSVNAQEILTPEDAVGLALNKNFDIIIAKNQADIAKINNNKGAANFLPKINLTTGDVFNLNNIHQELSSGAVTNKNWVPVNNFNAGLNLDWTVFDGLKMYATKDKLEALQSLGELQLQNQMQNVMASVLNAYYDIVRQKQQLVALKETEIISKERVSLSQKKFDIGYNNKLPLLQAQVDLSTQNINILKQETNLLQAKANLNEIIGRDANTDFEVIDTIEISYNANLQDIKDTAILENFSIKSALKNIEIAKFEHKEINSQRLPTIKFSSGYSMTQNNSKAGLLIANRTYGPNIGVNAIIPIFSGGAVKKQIEASAVNIATQQIQVDKIKQEINTKILNAYRDYEYAKKVWRLNEENVNIAKENVTITLENFRLNQATSLDIKTAQGSYEEALYSVILSRYQAKIAEISLKQLSNDLIK